MSFMSHISERLRDTAGLLGRGWDKILEAILAYSSRLLSICALYYRLLLLSFTSLAGFRLLWREVVRQVYFTALLGVHVLIFSSLMLGFIVILHSTQRLEMLQGENYVGWLLVTLVVREVGPVWAAFFVLLHSGSAITVDLGTMSVNGELEALSLLGIDPYRFLGVPRLWGLTISLMVLYVLCVFSAVLGGFLFTQIFTEVFWAKFWISFLNSLEWMDVAMGFTKCTSFGMLIATVSIYFGFRARRDMMEVARYTSQGSLVALVMCASVNIILSTAYYL
jgi:phospholipid/cholesterol/gamma-HCH transport system permease protein